MSEWDQTGAEAPPPKTPGWDAGAPPDPAWGEPTLRGLVAGQRVFGRFSLERMLGRGGMGVVWLALDEQLGLEVALKFLPDMVAHDRMALEDLREETLRSLRLTHPHIVRVYDFHQDGGCAAIAMEYVDGDTLSNMRLGRPGRVFTTGELLPWLQQACEALEYAHARAKIVHRDLKPANLMVNSAGEVRITDFGIARSLAESMTRVSGNIGTSGTLVYMSPQQARGIPPSPADDIYSLGATLYDLLTGKPPFYSGEIYQQILTELPPPMAQRRAELGVVGEPIPARWEAVVAACLDKEAARRPGSAQEIVARLGARGAGLEGRAPRGEPRATRDTTFNNQHSTTNVQGEGRAASNERRATSAEDGKRKTGKPVGAVLAAALIVAAVGAGGWWYGVEGPRQEAARAIEEQRLADDAARRAEVAEAEKARLARERLAKEEAQRQQAAEEERKRQMALEAVTGTVEVRSEPAGASVIWADGRRLGVTPLKLDKVPAGEMVLRLEMEGYEPAEARGTVVGGRETALGATLRALAQPFVAGTRAGQEMENSIGMKLCWCPAGEFMMGSPPDQEGRNDDEEQCPVRLSKGFWLGKYEVTQGEYERVMGSNPSQFIQAGSRAPVERVSWDDAVAFCKRLTEIERGAGRLPAGWEYRLPTEAQWEYACRAGRTEERGGELDQIGWYDKNSGGTTVPVGMKQANAWGLHDMLGNVSEWCVDGCNVRVVRVADPSMLALTTLIDSDPNTGIVVDPCGSAGADCVSRGGHWNSSCQGCRSSAREGILPTALRNNQGFRIVAVR